MSREIMFNLQSAFAAGRKTWLITGAAGFIGSNLAIALLRQGQSVVCLDNFVTGQRRNVEDIARVAQESGAGNYRFIEADICDLNACKAATQNVDYVLHQAALGSVPRSITAPIPTHQSNVDGFVNMLHAAELAKVKRFVYASSSSVYGDSEGLPKVEGRTGSVLSPYAATKAINELYAQVFQRTYGIECVGLRYFNVFGPRQDPNGAYAAVIPRWLLAMIKGTPLTVNGDGTTSRDFCYIENVIQANLRAALAPEKFPNAQVFNVAYGARTTLNELVEGLRIGLASAMNVNPDELRPVVVHADFRPGDIKHSLADTSSAQQILGYAPTHSLAQGLAETCPWYFTHQERLQ